ncbi:S-methyl-5'-thioadenosine phosphorylase [Herpetosiphon giganteus]|uniref:S-methyl-5'-thioadenosine phosphorylase n=1 Tax=Herpetosiphon giganteus TaxID=2029754 RepID=UPI00195CF3D8|nr:S-methyl-5'-thioadenosine phosphorylase [Herpetosiphon giganteus]MBM7841481.1 5'-methylthioadenosine phosphorylase [Herpetosiphon giganteus]
MEPISIGIIGGSGLYAMEALTDRSEIQLTTPFGEPSDAVIVGNLADQRVAFLPRHGRGHRFTPSEVPYRANIHALKQLGVRFILGVSAVGSLREELVPGHLVIPDQAIDRTKGVRPATFFGEGIVAHVAFGDPVCPHLSALVCQAAHAASGTTVHDGGTYCCMEGPQFSTKAESELYRSWGCSIIGMTLLPEAKLAREAEIAYANLSLVTDYDCWHPEHDNVTAAMVVETINRNVTAAQNTIAALIPLIDPAAVYPAHSALAHAVMTAPEAIPAATRERLALLYRG